MNLSASELRALADRVSAGLVAARSEIDDIDGFTRRSESGPSSRNSISDPVGNLATSGRLSSLTLLVEQAGAALDQIERSTGTLRIFADRFAPISAEPTTCCGDIAPSRIRSEWPEFDPTCRRIASSYSRKKGGPGVRWQGLCDACIKRFGKWCRTEGLDEADFRG